MSISGIQTSAIRLWFVKTSRQPNYGEDFQETGQPLNIHEVLGAPRSPWQNAFVERLIGSIRRKRLDHVLIFSERKRKTNYMGVGLREAGVGQ